MRNNVFRLEEISDQSILSHNSIEEILLILKHEIKRGSAIDLALMLASEEILKEVRDLNEFRKIVEKTHSRSTSFNTVRRLRIAFNLRQQLLTYKKTEIGKLYDELVRKFAA